jgi:hypothetical protein
MSQQAFKTITEADKSYPYLVSSTLADMTCQHNEENV